MAVDLAGWEAAASATAAAGSCTAEAERNAAFRRQIPRNAARLFANIGARESKGRKRPRPIKCSVLIVIDRSSGLYSGDRVNR